MIRFLFLIPFLCSLFIYVKFYEHHEFFYVKDENIEYGLANLMFIYLDLENYIQQTNMILLKEDAIDIKNILEDCYISNIKLDIKRK